MCICSLIILFFKIIHVSKMDEISPYAKTYNFLLAKNVALLSKFSYCIHALQSVPFTVALPTTEIQ